MKLLFYFLLYTTLIYSNTSIFENPKSKFFITFMAENGFPGHAFIGFGLESELMQKSYYAAYGFYPLNHKKSISPTEGFVKEDTFRHSDNTLIINVTYEQYKEAFKVLNKWRTNSFNGNQKYLLYNNNCIKFAKEIAESINLKVPISTTQFPKNFIMKLIEINQNQNQNKVVLSNNLSIDQELYAVYQFSSNEMDLQSRNTIFYPYPNKKEEYINKYFFRELFKNQQK